MKYDFHRLRQVPILQVAQHLGMDLVRCGTGVWALRDPDHPREPTSLRIFEKTNTFKRFSGIEIGGTSGGSPINLVMHIRDCSLQEAVEFLSSRFL